MSDKRPGRDDQVGELLDRDAVVEFGSVERAPELAVVAQSAELLRDLISIDESTMQTLAARCDNVPKNTGQDLEARSSPRS